MSIQPTQSVADMKAIATANNRRITAEHRAKRTDDLVDIDGNLTEEDIQALEKTAGYEMARPPSAGLMPMAAVSLARARMAVANGHADSVFSALHSMQQHGDITISDALLSAVANERDSTNDTQARAYLSTHTTRDFFA